ncbi:uncharacterized protein N7483_010375 [Penicillium malachiteum]|uniref:uncharacterized protein n=1 Tax=Penicillium malachiteum TaxID=1324776 RepID=UPI0025476C34|nr:uncharacterized protein N7483_010375 [Penicillium malachiteum]KAJ5713194.1 hypothetical protein N7483_010375 [Penicillium malachiteum]
MPVQQFLRDVSDRVRNRGTRDSPPREREEGQGRSRPTGRQRRANEAAQAEIVRRLNAASQAENARFKATRVTQAQLDEVVAARWKAVSGRAVAEAQGHDAANQGQALDDIWNFAARDLDKTEPGHPLKPTTSADPNEEVSAESGQSGEGQGSQAPSLTPSKTGALIQRIEGRGIQRQGWIENPDALNCPIGRTTMSIGDLETQDIHMDKEQYL